MSIGTGIALFVIGAILAFAVNLENSVVDLDMVGYLLMGAGTIVFLIGIILLVRKRQTVTTVQSGVDPSTGAGVTERRTASTPPADVV
ncbi:membrane-bound ClpP family serine protease [Microbacteriaceae bacterium SG_E_30_P1]|uniref:Membrane-bound ClpP family serine protease n=1 Tax=Antiquaquibacter oligotrophicus TaxID=2880260 RepID=A0ABT6KQZ1_9MICO|nr:DUF6458 family protein [Antiquaquibacter oligotrophicus]MDH6181527.1 membrane-bound ClpP family serine protease [Antiquaquibacter oligotrophicus]UDF12783.1 DUF6458 family protein [Antiquaquibacter oligotrophicus]